MRHLINTYIQANQADSLGTMEEYSLVELIVKTGIHDAIAKKLNEKGKLSNNAIAEGIINNVRKTIIRDQLTDPKFYKEMSKLLDDLIKQKRDDTKSYEDFLKKAEELVNKMAKGQSDPGIPPELRDKREASIIYNNLPDMLTKSSSGNSWKEPPADYASARLELALAIDHAMREQAPAGWRGDETREKQVLNALFPLMKRDREVTMALFELIKNMNGY